jgi:hypothetical protein
VRRLTYNLSGDIDPFQMDDGRILFASWQRSRIEHGRLGKWRLFGVNLDGADFARFAEDAGRRVQHMPCVTGGLVVFVETDAPPWDGAGTLGSVQLRRPLHSYAPLTQPEAGLFHSPSPLPDGSLLLSRRRQDESHAILRFDPQSGDLDPVFDDPRFHDIQACVIYPRAEPDGRSSVVTEEDPRGKLYCLNTYLTDFPDRSWLPRGSVKRLRVLEGLPRREPIRPRASQLVPRRILGEVDVAPDGSFHLDVPANTPIELQTLDENGMALRSCSWIWTKNHEPRGCIGCHEDGELTPENYLVDSMQQTAASLAKPGMPRSTITYLRDVRPIVQAKCVPCHAADGAEPRLDETAETSVAADHAYQNLLTTAKEGEFIGTYVHPGRARTSPLVWHLLGRNTSRPWDGEMTDLPVKPIPAGDTPAIDEDERNTIIQWIDLGAPWDAPPAADLNQDKTKGSGK